MSDEYLICEGGVQERVAIVDPPLTNFFRKLGSSNKDIREAYKGYKKERPRSIRSDVIPFAVFKANYLAGLARELEVDLVVMDIKKIIKAMRKEAENGN